MLLPRCSGPAGSGNADGGNNEATPTAQPADSSERSQGTAAEAAALAAATLEDTSCLPPYTRFLDYSDGSGDVGEEGGSGAAAAAAAAASLVCVAAGGGRVKMDRVLALRVGGGSGEGQAVRATSIRWMLLWYWEYTADTRFIFFMYSECVLCRSVSM